MVSVSGCTDIEAVILEGTHKRLASIGADTGKRLGRSLVDGGTHLLEQVNGDGVVKFGHDWFFLGWHVELPRAKDSHEVGVEL
jgi:hypothetical protein